MNICMRKMGMEQVKLQNNKVVGVTFLWCEMLRVLAHKTPDRDGYSAMVLGFGKTKPKTWNKAQHYLFSGQETAPESIYEYRTDDLAEIGSEINPVDSFLFGSYVDVAGTSKGRGFAGVMKRHNFHGLGASHGVSKAHRKAGSTGQNEPARVFKGKKMPGHYGHERITVQSLKVVFADNMTLDGKNGAVIGVHGAVPGPNQGMCFVKHAVKRGGVK